MIDGEVTRGPRWVDGLRFSWIDLKLGARMLVKYPVLTLVGGLAMAFAIWIGAGTFEILRQFVYPVIPLPQADRIVVLQNWDASASQLETRLTQDLLAWRRSVTTVDDLGAFRTVERNLMVTEGSAEPVIVAEMSAATFRALRVTTLLGRPLADADEAPNAPSVAVIGFDLWQNRLQGDPDVVGRSIRISGTPATIIGVMPEGFAFPRSHEIWTPLTLDATSARREGAGISVVGRLAEGATLEQARIELARIGSLAASDHPATHQHLRPRVITFSESVSPVAGGDGMMVFYGNLFVIMLLTLVCANVGLLMFARAATRETEIVVRSALGATRARIVMQLFVEALVLGTVAALIGLAAAAWGLDWALSLLRGEIVDGSGNYPFWVTGTLSPMTVAYAVLLTIIAAVITGLLPGLRITRGLSDRLKRTSAGSGGAGFGGVWTVIIVLQVAITMGFPVATFFIRDGATRLATSRLPVPIDRFVAVHLGMERTTPGDTADTTFRPRFVSAVARLEDKLLAEPDVEGVAFAQLLPRQYHPNHKIEVDEGAVEPHDERGHLAGTVDVEPRFFDLFGVSMLSGRAFTSSDVASEARVAIVNKPFVDSILGGRNPIGRRVRYVYGRYGRAADTSWYEIVGMAPDLGTRAGWGPYGIYHPLQRASLYPIRAAVRVRGNPADFAPRLRAIATDVEPTLQVSGLMPLEDVVNDEVSFQQLFVRLTTVFSGIVLMLSLVAIYAVMSYAVSRRTREIGVRVALGASRAHIVRAVFAHPLKQVAWGLLAGMALVFLLVGGLDSRPTITDLVILVVVAIGMLGACTLACMVPTRRALAVQPMDALRSD